MWLEAATVLRQPGPCTMATETVQIVCPSCDNTVDVDRPLDKDGAGLVECCFCGVELEIPRREEEPQETRQRSDDAPAATPDMPTAEPFFLPMPEDVPEQLRGIIAEAVCLRCSGDRGSGLFGNADEILAMFLRPEEFAEYDDPHWSSFGEIGASLQALFPAWGDGECFCIFASRARGVWAVGIGNKKKNRTDAGKVALAASIAAMSIVHNEPPPENLQSYPAFVSCLREVKRLVG